MPVMVLIDWDIFDFFSATSERNASKPDMKHDLNILYQILVFRAYRKTKRAALASYWLRHSATTERNSTKLDVKQDPTVSYQVCGGFFSGRLENSRWPPWLLIFWDIFNFLFSTAEQKSTKFYIKKKKISTSSMSSLVALTSNVRWHFQLLLCDH